MEQFPYYLGGPFWANKNWLGSLFREKTPASKFLSEYAKCFNTVECNSTFYTWPSRESLEKWNEEVPDYFRFSFKWPKRVSHELLLRESEAEIERFLKSLEPIKQKVGQLFLQLPNLFSPKLLGDLESFLKLMPQDMTMSVEVRHLDFYLNQSIEKELNQMLNQYRVNRAMFDTSFLQGLESRDDSIIKAQNKKPKLPRKWIATSAKPMLRYVGSNEVEENISELQLVAEKVSKWIRDGREPYVFIHSPDDVLVPQLCRRFHDLLQQQMPDLDDLPEWPKEHQQDDFGWL